MFDKKARKAEELYNEYIDILKAVPDPVQALAQLDYLHPITMARLKKIIRAKAKNGTTQAASF